VPFLDYNFVDLYLSLDVQTRMVQPQQINGKLVPCEKWLLRKAFESTKLIPEQVLWRKKEAFSDGVSS
jgi:asparagine synthase (glutamine-hydrolysing)